MTKKLTRQAEKLKEKELNLLSLNLPLLLAHHHSQTDLAASKRIYTETDIFFNSLHNWKTKCAQYCCLPIQLTTLELKRRLEA